MTEPCGTDDFTEYYHPDYTHWRWLRQGEFSRILEKNGYTNIASHYPKGKYEKGKPTAYKLCLDMCKKLKISPAHVKTLRKHRDIFRYESIALDGIWETVHDHLINMHNMKCDEINEPIEQSNILQELSKKINLCHIEQLIKPYYEQKKETLQFWDNAYNGVYIHIQHLSAYCEYGKPLPLDLVKALKALDIKFCIVNQPILPQLPKFPQVDTPQNDIQEDTFDQEIMSDFIKTLKALSTPQNDIQEIYDIMNEENPQISIPSLL